MSPLSKAVDDYLGLRRRLGYKLRDPGTYLHHFISWLERQGASHITTELALRWAMQPANAQPAHWAARLRAVRLFAQHHSASDPSTEIPPLGLLPYRFRRKLPHIYSVTEIRRLMAATIGLHSTTGLRPWTYSTLLGLLAVTGLRISEALGLNLDDVDLKEGVLTIRSTNSIRHVSSQYTRPPGRRCGAMRAAASGSSRGRRRQASSSRNGTRGWSSPA